MKHACYKQLVFYIYDKKQRRLDFEKIYIVNDCSIFSSIRYFRRCIG